MKAPIHNDIGDKKSVPCPYQDAFVGSAFCTHICKHFISSTGNIDKNIITIQCKAERLHKNLKKILGKK